MEDAFKNSNKFSTTIITSPSHGNHPLRDKVFHPGTFPYLDNARQDNAPRQGICHILWEGDIYRRHTRDHCDGSLLSEVRRRVVYQDLPTQEVVNRDHNSPGMIIKSSLVNCKITINLAYQR